MFSTKSILQVLFPYMSYRLGRWKKSHLLTFLVRGAGLGRWKKCHLPTFLVYIYIYIPIHSYILIYSYIFLYILIYSYIYLADFAVAVSICRRKPNENCGELHWRPDGSTGFRCGRILLPWCSPKYDIVLSMHSPSVCVWRASACPSAGMVRLPDGSAGWLTISCVWCKWGLVSVVFCRLCLIHAEGPLIKDRIIYKEM